MGSFGQIGHIISSLSLKQRAAIVCAAIAAVAAVLSFSHWSKESNFKPLYTNLAPEDAGAVVQKLKESGTEFRLSENGTTVLGPSSRIAEIRLEMASAGLPKSGRIGFELFDKTNFGATEFAEHINYRRALEGELERSIMSVSAVEQARVHLTFPKDSVFLESRQAGKASAILRLRPGSRLLPQNVTALTNLIASAVEGLTPEAVTLLDTRGNLLSLPKRASTDPDAAQPSDATLEYRQKLENNLLAKVNATLEPLLGSGRFRTGVSVDCDFTSGEQSEETLDPNKSVMVTSQKTEDASAPAVSSGTPGTASNLPRPPGRIGYGANGISRKTENITYQTSRLVRHVRLPQGTVKRISLSVLLDNDLKWEGAGKKMKRVLTPPTAEKLKTIRELVSGIAGLSTERGDVLVVESLPFESTSSSEPPSELSPSAPAVDPRIPKWLAPLLSDSRSFVIAAIVGATAVLLLFGLLFLLLRKGKKKPSVQSPVALPGAHELERKKETGAEAALSPVDGGVPEPDRLQIREEAQRQLDQELSNQLSLPTLTSKKGEVLVKLLRDMIQKDNATATNVVRTWLTEKGASVR